MDEDPSYEVEISREVEPAGDFDEPQIRQAIELLLGRHGCSRAELSIALVDDRRIAELNEQYLDHQGPTDVLSFDLADAGASGIEGQVVVSVETARREAGQRGHAAGAEGLLYCVHGVLHAPAGLR